MNTYINETNVPTDQKYHIFNIDASTGAYMVKAIRIGQFWSGEIHPITPRAIEDGSYSFVRQVGADAVLKKLGSSDVTYKMLYNQAYTDSSGTYTFTEEYKFAIVILAGGRNGNNKVTEFTCTPSNCTINQLVNWTRGSDATKATSGGYIGIITGIQPNVSAITTKVYYYGQATIIGVK